MEEGNLVNGTFVCAMTDALFLLMISNCASVIKPVVVLNG